MQSSFSLCMASAAFATHKHSQTSRGTNTYPGDCLRDDTQAARVEPFFAGKIDLYVGKEVVQRGIPMDTAPDALVQLIKDHGKWVEPSSDEDEDEDLEAAAAARLANGTATF